MRAMATARFLSRLAEPLPSLPCDTVPPPDGGNGEGQARGHRVACTFWETVLSAHWNDISVSKPIPLNDFTDCDRDGFWKHWSTHDDRVDFSVLSTWVAILWELRKQLP